MLVEFFVEKNGKKTPVHHPEEMIPVSKPYLKKVIHEVDGEFIEKMSVRSTESWQCFMAGAQAYRIAKAIGLSNGCNLGGKWSLSKKMYKKAIKYINNPSCAQKLDKKLEKSQNKPKLSRRLANRRAQKLLVGQNVG